MSTPSLKQRIRDGHAPLGTMIFEFFVPGLPQMAQASGADFLLYDMEHSGAGFETLKAQCAACAGLSVAPLVRVPAHDYAFVARALDIGAHGVMMPMVADAAQARELVNWTRYPPLGKRGAAFALAHDGYRPGEVLAKIGAAHERTLVIAMIETPQGVANVEAIAAVEGVDALFLGHSDLTNFMGIAGQFEHPDFEAAIRAIGAAAQRHGKLAATLAASPAWARRFHALGYRMFAWGLDAHLFQGALSQGLQTLRALE